MGDHGHDYADGQLAAFEAEVADVYGQAEQQARKDLDAFLEEFRERDDEKRAELEAGKISERAYADWRRSQMMTGMRYQQVLDQVAEAYSNANEVAVAALNGRLPDVYAENANYGGWQVCEASGLDVSFSLMDASTAQHMLTAGEALIAPPALNVAKDLAWNRKLLASQLTQGVLLGESIPKLAKRVQRVTGSNYAAAVRTARTAVTGAENAGRVRSYGLARAMGIKLRKEWLATLDGRTRHTHRKLDKAKAPDPGKFENGCRFPGDPQGPYSEICNCRCTLVPAIDGIDQDGAERWSRLPPGMTYEQWKAGKPVYRHDSSGRTMGEFMQQPSVQKNLEKRGMTEAQGRKALSEHLKASGTSGHAFRTMQKSEQQQAWRAALVSKHAEERMAERGLTRHEVDDAIANPLHAFEPTVDLQGRRAQKLVGASATVVVNPDTGVIITMYKTGRRERRKYGLDE